MAAPIIRYGNIIYCLQASFTKGLLIVRPALIGVVAPPVTTATTNIIIPIQVDGLLIVDVISSIP
jgi:hypothetical protein